MTFPWPRACADDPVVAGFKLAAEDFRVSETLAFALNGSGEHLYLRLRKRHLATPAVADALAEAFGVENVAVGFAGMKDKHAVAEQWFSVATDRDADALPPLAGIELVESGRHSRKLRRGELSENLFQIRLAGVAAAGWEARLADLAQQGAPNYFGPQRFGRDNLRAAMGWLPERRKRRISRFQQGLYLSVVRSFLFNEVLGARVVAGNWNRILTGDVIEHGALGAEPAGPLWGRGRSAAQGDALAIEAAALRPHAALLDGLEHAGMTQGRRPLVLRPTGLTWTRCGRDVQIRFALGPGCYATSLLREVFSLQSPGAEAA